MQIIAPDYYKNFKCTAADCKHSCCIGWEIDIDTDTLDIYKNITGAWGERFKNGVSYDGGTPHFITDKDGRCAFLNKNGLCDIITEFGEDGLCQICYDHPRFRNFYSDRVEIGLGLCCEAAAELILSGENKMQFTILEDDGEEQSPTSKEVDILEQRDLLFNLLQNKDFSLKEIMQKAAEIYGIAPFGGKVSSLVQKYRSLERLDEKWDEYLNITEQISFDSDYILAYANKNIPLPARNLLCYFTYRYFATEAVKSNSKGAVKFILEGTFFCIAVWLCVCDELNAKSFAEICRMFSLETEYSEENIELLLKGPTKNP